MVVNFIDDFIFVFYFCISSNYFRKFLSIIFIDTVSAPLNLYLFKLFSPGFFDFEGYYSIIFYSLAFYFSRVVIFV